MFGGSSRRRGRALRGRPETDDQRAKEEMDHRGSSGKDGRDEGREDAAEGNAHGEDEAEDTFGAVDRQEDRKQQDDVENVLRHGGNVVREGDREEGAEEGRNGEASDHARGQPRGFPTP